MEAETPSTAGNLSVFGGTETPVNRRFHLIHCITAQQTEISISFDNCNFSTDQFVFL